MSNKCRNCSKLVYDIEKIASHGFTYHKRCFRCTTCLGTLNLLNYVSFQTFIYCKPHYDIVKFDKTAPTKTPQTVISQIRSATNAPASKEKKSFSEELKTDVDQRAYILDLPNEILLQIASSIPSANDLAQFATTCRSLSFVMGDSILWKSFFDSYGFSIESNTDPNVDWRAYFFQRARTETKVTVRFLEERSLEVRIDPLQTKQDLFKFLCREFSIFYTKPFKLYMAYKQEPLKLEGRFSNSEIREFWKNRSLCFQIRT